jgi:hypothetical protein
MGPGGAQTTMRLSNTGAPCRYVLFHRVEERIPTGSVAIAVAPQSGRAVAIQPNVVQYTPNPGFAGMDRFTVDATPAPFRVAFSVEVLPPSGRP